MVYRIEGVLISYGVGRLSPLDLPCNSNPGARGIFWLITQLLYVKCHGAMQKPKQKAR